MSDLDDQLKQAEELAKRDNESKENAKKWTRPSSHQTPEERQREVEEIIKNLTNAPRRPYSYFDPINGWIAPEDGYESNTYASLKTIIAALKAGEKSEGELPSDLYDAVEQLLYEWSVFIRQGIREKIANHKGVSWYLALDDIAGRAFVSYQEGPAGEWQNDCYADQVPLWLLLALFRRIARRKPLGHQKADDTISRVDALDAEYVRTKERRELEKQLGLHLTGRRGEV